VSTEDALTGQHEQTRKERSGRELVAEVFAFLALPLVQLLRRLRVPPPAVVLAHSAVGLLAAVAIGAEAFVAAAVLLQLKTLLDNADGQLARASGRVTALGRYLDTEADFLVNAALFVALASVTGASWLALAAFAGVTLVLSVDHVLTGMYDEAHGRSLSAPRSSENGLEAVLERLYDVVFRPQDRAIRAFVEGRFRRRLRGAPDSERPGDVRRAYHDRETLTVLANLGLSSQLFALGVCLVAGAPEVYLWLVVCSLVLLPVLQLRRERLARDAALRS